MTVISEIFADLPAAVGSRLLRDLQTLPVVSAYLVAFSGGLDSLVLLHALARYCRADPNPRLKALHVHHGLSPNADAWAAHCMVQCEALGVELEVVRTRVSAEGEGLEAAARKVRYAAFEAALGQGEVLVLAHHQDDQAETLLLNLMRGSGVKGLAAMPRQRPLGRGELRRPLLDWTRAELEAVATTWRLSWIDDESNLSLAFDRNYLRHQILPHLRQRWPAVVTRLARSAQWSREADQLLMEVAVQDLEGVACGPSELDLFRLAQLSPLRQRNLLRVWLEREGAGFPGEQNFERIFTEVIPARIDAAPELRWPGQLLRRYRGKLALARDEREAKVDLVQPWDCRQILRLPGGELTACLSPTQHDPAPRLRLPRQGEVVTVRFRSGGERCRPAHNGLNRPLKKLLQEWGVPPWLRANLPLIYFDDNLAAVPGYLISLGFEAAPEEPGVLLAWRAELE